MIYLITGDDFNKASGAFNKYLGILRAKQPAASVFSFTPEDFNAGAFEEVARGETLFFTKHIVTARRLGESEAAMALIKDLAKVMAESASVFLFYEPEASSDVVKVLTKQAKEVKTFPLKVVEKKEFNVFALTDALGRRDREKLWVLYQTALRVGVSPGDIFWRFIWQVKNMLIVSSVKDIQTTGLKPFVANKALTASRNFSNAEVKNLLDNFIDLLATTFPDSDEFTFGLEKIILTI